MKLRTELLLGALVGLAPVAALAGIGERLPTETPLLAEVRVAAPAPAAEQPGKKSAGGWASAVDAGRLADSRGGTDIIRNEARLNGGVSGNSATGVISGANIIDNGSFANSSGLPVVIQNSGSNVLIQNATVINLQLK